MKELSTSTHTPLSRYCNSLNTLAGTKWPLFEDAPPWKIVFSRKSCLRPFESPALLNIRARSLFGASARADLVTFFLTHNRSDFAVSDLSELGYSKRNLAILLEEISLSGLFEKHMLRNQLRYRLAKNDHLAAILAPIPSYAPSWFTILKILLPIRDCIIRNEQASESTLAVEIRNILISMQDLLHRLKLSAPPFQSDLSSYLKVFGKWILNITVDLTQGNHKVL
jgi:hypothetical protein